MRLSRLSRTSRSFPGSRMGPWFRVFGLHDTPPEPASIKACLAGILPSVRMRFDGQEDWFAGELWVGTSDQVLLERYKSSEDGIRAELNSWAAYLETCVDSPEHVRLMERTIQS